MTSGSTGRPELVCTPGAVPPELHAAHLALVKDLFSRRDLEREWVPGGLRMSFPLSDLEMLERFAAYERTCCPFLDLRITAPDAAGKLWLSILGPAEARAIIETYFSPMMEE